MSEAGDALPEPQSKIDERWMRRAIREANKAMAAGEVPVGAVVVAGERLLGSAHNQRELLRDPTAHAEMIALTQAAEAMDTWRLNGATMYVTLEPCVMCAGALMNARIDRVVFGAPDERFGACGSLYQIGEDPRLNHRFAVEGGVLAAECAAVLHEFFSSKRG